MKKEKFEKMLNNASNIQYLLNLVKDSEWNLLFEPCIGRHGKVLGPHTLQYVTSEGWCYYPLTEKEYRFLLKGRGLRSGLATPMSRYYGYKAIA